MNLKLSSHELRLRISSPEAKLLLENGEFMESLRWSENHSLLCSLKVGPASFESDSNRIQLSIPRGRLSQALRDKKKDPVLSLEVAGGFRVAFEIDIFKRE